MKFQLVKGTKCLFSNKVVIITSGTSGISQSTAKEFDKGGAKLTIFERNKEKLNQVQV